jgi:hypothetical protein
MDLPCGDIRVSAAYPNPVAVTGSGVRVNLRTSCPMRVGWSVVTTAHRKLYGEEAQVDGGKTVTWDLRDGKGTPVARGLYFMKFTGGHRSVILKVLVQ